MRKDQQTRQEYLRARTGIRSVRKASGLADEVELKRALKKLLDKGKGHVLDLTQRKDSTYKSS